MDRYETAALMLSFCPICWRKEVTVNIKKKHTAACYKSLSFPVWPAFCSLQGKLAFPIEPAVSGCSGPRGP